MSSLGDVGSGIVADVEVEGSYQHQGLVEDLVDVLAVGFNSSDTVCVEAVAGVTE